ncbi:patatin-like phospholipase family protein [Nocardia sp. NPDC006630]|uniref:patatin-like phospholipase family protein n=1 Tax=Nocardia sp. NPDC006630 TaxID=3157181 RepID=UPI0033AF3C7B
MSDAVSPNGIRHALVLGGGGAVGIFWMVGLAAGLRAAGVDLALADRFVGTSAGAVVGAMLAGGGELPSPETRPAPDTTQAQPNLNGFTEIMTLAATPGLTPAEVVQRIGARALELQVGDPADHIARISDLAGVSDWPDADLIVTALDTTTGELQTWTRTGMASLPEALASSTAVPGVFPPIPIRGHHYIDGGLRSPINADLAAGADLIVIIEPLAHLFPHSPSDSQLGGATTLSIVPDADTLTAFGQDLFDISTLVPAYEAGVRQASDAALRLKAVWPTR